MLYINILITLNKFQFLLDIYLLGYFFQTTYNNGQNWPCIWNFIINYILFNVLEQTVYKENAWEVSCPVHYGLLRNIKFVLLSLFCLTQTFFIFGSRNMYVVWGVLYTEYKLQYKTDFMKNIRIEQNNNTT